MAPRGARRAEGSSPRAFHELGVRGRKTGVTLPDRGERDEHGMQPLDSIFSSPRKSRASSSVGRGGGGGGGGDDSGSEDMDIASSAGPGPRTLLKGRRSVQYPIPKSRSPLKTNLKSPAKRNPNLEYLSSPARRSAAEDRDVTVTRRLDFAGRASGPRSAAAKGKAVGMNGNAFDDEGDEDDDDGDPMGGGDDDEVLDMLEQSLQMVDDMDDVPEDEPVYDNDFEEEEEEEQFVRQPSGRRGRPPKQREEVQTARGSKKRRSLRDSTDMNDIQEEEEGYEEDEEPEEELRGAKRQRTKGPAAAKAQAAKATKAKSPSAKPRGRPPGRPKGPGGRKPKLSTVGEEGEASFMALQRGPPMPKSRGLVSVRRDADSVQQTRSGRHSYRPLDYWRGEQVVPDEVEVEDYDFVLPTMKAVIRVPEEEAKRGPRAKGRPKARSKAAQAEEDEPEEWELNPGVVSTEVVLWEPEHELHPPAEDEPVQVMEEQVALSKHAVQTKDIRDSTFRFAKTLTMPFMGAGVVDLPPGAEKRPKNSRKMHMVFFVHTGKIMVTVNEAQFRINAGGMWFVPRGNYYSITNDYDDDARVFFAQACEVAAQPLEYAEE